MNHDICQEKLIDLIYGELPKREAAEVEAHLEGCNDCRGDFERLASTRRTMATLGTEAAPAHGEHLLATSARHAVEQRAESKRRPFLPAWAWRVSLSTAVVLVVGSVAVNVYLSSRSELDALTSPERFAKAPAPAVEPLVKSTSAAPADTRADAKKAKITAKEERPYAQPPPPVAVKTPTSLRRTAGERERSDDGFAQGPMAEQKGSGRGGSLAADAPAGIGGVGSGAGTAAPLRYAQPPPPIPSEPAGALASPEPPRPAAMAPAKTAPRVEAKPEQYRDRAESNETAKRRSAPSAAPAAAPAATHDKSGAASETDADAEESAPSPDNARAEALFYRAQQAERDGKTAAAVELYGTLVREFRGHPRWRAAAEARVRLLRQLGRAAEAEILERELR